LDLAKEQNATVPVMIGHRMAGISLLFGGSIIEGRDHLDRAIAVYDVTHRPLAMRFGQDAGVTVLTWRSLALWLLGHSMAARADAALAVKTAREMGHAPTLMFALHNTAITYLLCSDDRMANALLHEGTMLAEEKGATFWTALGLTMRGCISVLTVQAANAVRVITSGLTAYRSTGSTLFTPLFLSHLARAYVSDGLYEDAEHSIGEAVAALGSGKECWHEAEVYRIAGEIASVSPEQDAAKAETYFERALAVSRQQQAKSWELRAAMSMARLWRDQGKREEARDLLAPVYGWFTEGFDTLDLKEAKKLLDDLAL
jgi:predicted ATPase